MTGVDDYPFPLPHPTYRISANVEPAGPACPARILPIRAAAKRLSLSQTSRWRLPVMRIDPIAAGAAATGVAPVGHGPIIPAWTVDP